MSAHTEIRQVSLEDKYVADAGSALISGVQALVRLFIEQRRIDAERGLDTAVFVSGYQGSPLGGLDLELGRARSHLDGIVFKPGLNEELAATAVAGTQLVGELDRPPHEGIVGFWYGKNPGLDRAADAIRHGNVSGTAPLGGAVALIGDDPGSKSSTIPSSCEPMCRSLLMPLLAPGTVGELIELGLHAVALSRASGLWCGLKIVSDVADASATVSLEGIGTEIPVPERRAYEPPVLLPPTTVEAEADLIDQRLRRALDYVRSAGLNRIAFEPARPRRALIAAGLAYQAVVRALEDLGLDEAALDRLGLRLAKLAMPWPPDPEYVAAVADGVEEIVVVEDKFPFLETQVKEALYGRPATPRVRGRRDLVGGATVPPSGGVLVDDATRLLRAWLGEEAQLGASLDVIPSGGEAGQAPLSAKRTPYFCSGCPHNRSTKAADDSVVGTGIGCHIMIALDEGGRGKLLGMPQMGGEGAQFIGLAAFAGDLHFVQNVGDGTFHHSGSLALRAAVASGMRITYKILYNDAVAMTGGQHPEGQLSVVALTRLLASEGVRRTVVLTPEPKGYRGAELDPLAEVRHRDRLAETELELRALDGVTAIVYDDRCATEERRLRRRKQLPTPRQRVWINERVCEGCGDCGEKSTCLSVQPVETEFGRKTRIHQASCNQDFSCLDGDCPSFLVVEPGKGKGRPAAPEPPADLPEPPPATEEVLVRMPGIGGTGVVTVSQVLQMAAHLDGKQAAGLEQTGLAQKGGPVISDLRIGPAAAAGSLRAGRGEADLLVGFDLLGAANRSNLEVADPDRTVAIVSTSRVPTARMVTDTQARFPAEASLRGRIDAATRSERNVYLDAQGLALSLFGDHLPANLLLIGAAYQSGCLPISAAAIERAIELNGAAVEVNVRAFRWGRAAIARPRSLPEPTADEAGGGERPTELADVVERLAAELVDYQSRRYARAYEEEVRATAARIEAAVGDAGAPIAVAYARGLYKLMAYKDEYEVARLHLDAVERARMEGEFGPGARFKIKLHPPLLRALGLKRKLSFGRWALPLLALLRRGKVLRGHVWDPFGHARVRRTERALIGEYRSLVETAVAALDEDNVAAVLELAELPDLVRGYEEIKLGNVERFRGRAAVLTEGLSTRQM